MWVGKQVYCLLECIYFILTFYKHSRKSGPCKSAIKFFKHFSIPLNLFYFKGPHINLRGSLAGRKHYLFSRLADSLSPFFPLNLYINKTLLDPLNKVSIGTYPLASSAAMPGFLFYSHACTQTKTPKFENSLNSETGQIRNLPKFAHNENALIWKRPEFAKRNLPVFGIVSAGPYARMRQKWKLDEFGQNKKRAYSPRHRTGSIPSLRANFP